VMAPNTGHQADSYAAAYAQSRYCDTMSLFEVVPLAVRRGNHPYHRVNLGA
jgi:hypothetical protein